MMLLFSTSPSRAATPCRTSSSSSWRLLNVSSLVLPSRWPKTLLFTLHPVYRRSELLSPASLRVCCPTTSMAEMAKRSNFSATRSHGKCAPFRVCANMPADGILKAAQCQRWKPCHFGMTSAKAAALPCSRESHGLQPMPWMAPPKLRVQFRLNVTGGLCFLADGNVPGPKLVWEQPGAAGGCPGVLPARLFDALCVQVFTSSWMWPACHGPASSTPLSAGTACPTQALPRPVPGAHTLKGDGCPNSTPHLERCSFFISFCHLLRIRFCRELLRSFLFGVTVSPTAQCVLLSTFNTEATQHGPNITAGGDCCSYSQGDYFERVQVFGFASAKFCVLIIRHPRQRRPAIQHPRKHPRSLRARNPKLPGR